MQIYREVSPYQFLMNDSWECDDLKSKIEEAGVSDLDFDSVVEEYFSEASVSETKLNDFFRFEAETLLSALGIDYDEEDGE